MEFDERDLIASPLSVEEIGSLRNELGSLVPLISKKSPKFRQYGPGLSDEQWMEEMANEPRLIKRPIWRVNQQLIVGFDPHEWTKAL